MQVPQIQAPQAYAPAPAAQPNYNAVKIDIHNPQVNTPSTPQAVSQPITAPIYGSVPTASVYEVPQQSIYQPQQNFNQPPTVQEMPSVPQPVIVQPTVNPAPVAPTVPPAPVAVAPTQAPPAQPVEVKAPEASSPQVDLNAFLGKLANPDYDVQASAMESIADLAQNSPAKATELLDVKVIDTLLGIMQNDTSKLAGPSAQQLQIREKIMSGKPVTEAETAEANKI